MPQLPPSDVRAAVIGSIVIRLALIAAMAATGRMDAALTPDSASYLVAARALATGAGFLDTFGGPEVARTPGYPLLLVPGMWLNAPIAWALLAQVGLSALLVAQVGALARDVGLPPQASRLAAWICAADPWMVVLTTRVMTEVACVVALTIGVRHVVRATVLGDQGARPHAWRAGGWLAVATYIRPLCGFAFLVLLVGLAWQAPRHARTARAVVCAIAFLALVAPWHVRNGWQTGYWGFSTMAPRALYLTLGGTAEAAAKGRPFSEVRLNRLAASAEATPSAMVARGWRDLIGAPGAVARAHVAGMVRVVADPGGIEVIRSVGLYPRAGGLLAVILEQGLWTGLLQLGRTHPGAMIAVAATAIALLVWPLAIAGWPGMPHAVRTPWAALVIVVTLVSGGVHGNGRFRVIVLPVLAVMAGGGALRLANRYTRVHR